MGRVIVQLAVQNSQHPGSTIHCDALVDTGSAYLTLPSAWQDRLGKLETLGAVELELGNQQRARGEVCGPVRIQLEGFRPIYSEVLFIDMQPHDGQYEPLLGYIPLEQSQAAVDMLGHRLVPVKYVDLKRLQVGRRQEVSRNATHLAL